MSNGTQKPEPCSINVNVHDLFDIVTDGEDLAEIVSPEGGERNHPIAVRVNRGGEITEVTEHGTRVSSGTAYQRGVRIEIDFDPETQDDPWTLALSFHKGDTYVQVLQRRGDERFPPGRSVIWRD